MDNKDKVLDAMKKAGKPVKAGELAEISGIEKKEVEKAMKVLLAEEKIFSPKRCFYSPK